VSAPEDTDDTARADYAPDGKPRRRRWLLWAGVSFGTLLLLAVVAVNWVLNTEGGTRWAANRAIGMMGGKLAIASIEGTLAGPITVNGIRFNNPDAGADVRVARVSTDLALMELFSRRVHVLTLNVNGVDVRLSEPLKKEEEPSQFSLEPPIDVLLDSFVLRDARVSRDGKELFVARAAEASARWTSDGIAISKFVVDSPDGNVRLAGEVSGSDTYTGRMNGNFRWKVAEAQYEGELSAVSEKQELKANIRLSAPFTAQLEATVGETEQVPWQMALTVPRFDPRKEVLPGGSLESLAATLTGQGDRTFAELRGDITLNGQSLRIDPIRARYAEQLLTLEALTLQDPSRRGTLSATGTIQFAAAETQPPFNANLNVVWRDVELPKEWVGQALSTRGELKVAGNPATFNANGQLALGPPNNLADIALQIDGTPEQVQLQRLEILQKKGSLNIKGTVLLKPRIGWQLNANARTFDPGAFVAGWPGNLGFALDSKGELQEKGPNASFNLRNLKGTLRNRAIAGQADLTVNPDKVVAGTLNLSSGRSSIAVTGRGGQTMDLDAQFDVASLDDWAPSTTGRVNGKLHIAGTWPRIAVDGDVEGRDLALGEYSVKAVNLNADVRNPQSPSGTLRLDASTIIAAGFEFSSVKLDASGDEKAHTAHLDARGEPLSAEVRLQGARAGTDGWAGTVEQLDLRAAGISPLSLREPVKVAYNPREFSVSQTCLTGDQISACATAAQDTAGELTAKYTLEHLPLGLIAALAAPELPVRVEAVIEGNGDIRRAKDGALFGQAHVSSTSGRVSEVSAPAQEDAADALLTYENLKLDAELAGDTAQGSISAALNGSGRLEGQARLANLSGAAPTIDGSAKLSIPDLTPVELFVPQVANVKGSAEANVEVTGTLMEPLITGAARIQQFAAEVPQVGLKLHDGEVQASVKDTRNLAITGQLKSGDGQVSLTGDTNAEGVLHVKVQGKDFQAANIPGANVVIAPDLTFQRAPDRMQLWGTAVIPRAEVDLSKLPKQEGGTQASSDVVVVDDANAVEQSESVPLYVNVGLIVGKKENTGIIETDSKDEVRLIGYGLNARVDGWLDVHEQPGLPTTGNGEIRLSGFYKAYGQDLTIEQGRLLFAGQPIAEPQVNLIATRTVESVKAKLTVSGNARRPQLEVSADPTMSQTQALAYLVTGKPMDEVGSGEGDLVQSAARSLGGAAGNLLAKGLGKRLGISDIGVQDSDEIGGSAFTVGQYLSPRLYLSYGVGLFEPGQVVTLRYRISDKVSLEASQGPLNQKAGINYRIEKR
jgi:translocation and assembly module TamB